MRTTIDLPEDLVQEALRVSHATTKTMVIVLGLRELINRSKIDDLRKLRGTMPDFHVDIDRSRKRQR
jgi:Arc/MetJ family transcription regulator